VSENDTVSMNRIQNCRKPKFLTQWRSQGWRIEEEVGVRTLPLYGKCDDTFSYIFTNSTKLVLHLSYLIRLDCFSNACN